MRKGGFRLNSPKSSTVFWRLSKRVSVRSALILNHPEKSKFVTLGYKNGLQFLALFEKLSHGVQNRMSDQNWAAIAMERLTSCGAGEDFSDEDFDQLFGDEDGIRYKALLGTLDNVFPETDFDCRDGVTANSLGRFVGGLTNSLRGFVPSNERVQTLHRESTLRVEQLMPKAEHELKALSPERAAEFRAYVEMMSEVTQGMMEFCDELVGIEPEIQSAIDDCFRDARKQSSDEFNSFLNGVSLTAKIQTFSEDGRYQPANARTDFFRTRIGIMGEAVKDVVSNVPELHRVLIRFDSDRLLSRDEESLQWKDDHKSLEGVCRSLGLSFRKRGRPPTKKKPNTE